MCSRPWKKIQTQREKLSSKKVSLIFIVHPFVWTFRYAGSFTFDEGTSCDLGCNCPRVSFSHFRIEFLRLRLTFFGFTDSRLLFILRTISLLITLSTRKLLLSRGLLCHSVDSESSINSHFSVLLYEASTILNIRSLCASQGLDIKVQPMLSLFNPIMWCLPYS